MSENAGQLQRIAGEIRTGEDSATHQLDQALSRINEIDPTQACFRELCPEEAKAQAKLVDAAIARGEEVGPLAGVPIAVKDNIATSTGRTSCGSRFLEDYRSPFDATAVQRLVDAGAIIIGKTNCDEFGMGSSSEHCAYAQTRNPWDPSRVPGGSSGGSAAAIAAGMVPAALGSDTGGSVRQPAAFCGTVGLKPTYGRVSRYGLVAFGSSLDQIGPLASTVADAALLLQVMAGPDEHDATCSDVRVQDYLARLEEPVVDLRIGVAERLLDQTEPPLRAVIRQVIDTCAALGAQIVPVSLPHLEYCIATYYIIAMAEASANLARFDGVRYGRRASVTPEESLETMYARSRSEGFGAEVQRRIMLGTYVLSAGYYDAYYKRAQRVRRLIKQDFDRAFTDCHVLLGPTTPSVAFPFGDKPDPLSMYQCDLHTVPANLAGICAISIPAGHTEIDGKTLPIGAQLQGQAFDEPILLRAARMIERALAPTLARTRCPYPSRSADSPSL